MSYNKRLYNYVNSKGFVRIFTEKCKGCGNRLFNVKEEIEGDKIIAFFMCDCGEKYKKTVYSKDLKKYTCKQGIVKDYKQKTSKTPVKGIDFSVTLKRIFLVEKDRIVVKKVE